MRAAWAILLLVSASVLAGCSQGGGGAPADTITLGDGSQVELAEGAALVGVVVDEAIRPVAGANVTVLALNLTVSASAEGLFVFGELEPGIYNLVASAAGFVPITTQAEVREGETTRVRIQLARDLNPQPYHTTLQFEWFDAAGVTLVDFTIDLVSRSFLGGAVPPQCDRCYFYFDTDMPPEQLLFEAAWEDSIGFPADLKATSYFWTVDGLDSGDYEADYCESPCYVLVPMGNFGNDTHYGLALSGDEDWITYNQGARLFMTVWYLAGPPEGWSIIAGTGKP